MSDHWVELEVLPAGYGDALLLRYGRGRARHAILIDGGPAEESSLAPVSARLGQLGDDVDLLVVTHVDVDHVAGVVELLGSTELSSRVRSVWFNGYRHLERAGDWLGGIDGELLTTKILAMGVPWNEGFEPPVDADRLVGGPVVLPPRRPLPRAPLPGGAEAILLSPDPRQLERLRKEWSRVVRAAGLDPGRGAVRERRRGPIVSGDWLGVTDLDTLAATPTPRDAKPANGSSIAFVFCWGPWRLLLAGDAHPAVLERSLSLLAAEEGTDRVRLDACKLPHHGSAANVTTALVSALDCPDWIVSTNGARFDHPDDVALARVVRHAGGHPRIVANYRSERMLAWAALAPPDEHGYDLVLPDTGAGCTLSYGSRRTSRPLGRSHLTS